MDVAVFQARCFVVGVVLGMAAMLVGGVLVVLAGWGLVVMLLLLPSLVLLVPFRVSKQRHGLQVGADVRSIVATCWARGRAGMSSG